MSLKSLLSSQLFVVQGEGFGNCDNALGQTCVNNVSVGDEGSCRCRSPSVPDESLPVVTDVAARVVINERTGTVVVGGAVQLLPAVVAHGGL